MTNETNNIIEQGRLELLVIEDDPKFLSVAKATYDTESNIQVTYAKTYEEALQNFKLKKFDFVVSDLFFPSESSWITEITDRITPNIETCLKNVQKKMPWLTLDHHQKNFDRYFSSFKKLTENPSGLGIAEYCYENRIPFTIVSQGDRHQGSLSIVRDILPYHPTISWDYCLGDPICENFLYRGVNIDKNSASTWKDALYGNDGVIKRKKWKIFTSEQEEKT